jgi:hypothetical protein
MERWIMCRLRWHRKHQKLCSVRLVSIPSLLPFFFILELLILSFHKNLLDYIVWPCVSWKNPY